jgi:hypothetical protein
MNDCFDLFMGTLSGVVLALCVLLVAAFPTPEPRRVALPARCCIECHIKVDGTDRANPSSGRNGETVERIVPSNP